MDPYGISLKGKNLVSVIKFFPLKEAPYEKGDEYFHVKVTSLGDVSVTFKHKSRYFGCAK